jgi:hypothetical protein
MHGDADVHQRHVQCPVCNVRICGNDYHDIDLSLGLGPKLLDESLRNTAYLPGSDSHGHDASPVRVYVPLPIGNDL